MAQASDQTEGGDLIEIPAQGITSCGDITCELLVDPIARPTPDPIAVTLKPKVPKVTFVDHHKPNSIVIMKHAQDILRERGIEVSDEIVLKDDASNRMPEAMLKSFAGEGGLVLCGISD